MDIPSREHTFFFKDKGERTRKNYEGNFTVKALLTQQEIVDVGMLLDQYSRGSKTLVQGVALLNRAFAELDVRIVKAPAFWKDSNQGRDLLDTNIVFGIYKASMDAESEYDKKLEEAAKAADEFSKPKKKEEEE
jgi:hypothetical protein